MENRIIQSLVSLNFGEHAFSGKSLCDFRKIIPEKNVFLYLFASDSPCQQIGVVEFDLCVGSRDLLLTSISGYKEEHDELYTWAVYCVLCISAGAILMWLLSEINID